MFDSFEKTATFTTRGFPFQPYGLLCLKGVIPQAADRTDNAVFGTRWAHWEVSFHG